ncbi:MAG: hypothetical protein IJW03_05820 [Clostridia bacterium]|nr:hypothetical protein [Clostridia bacterium]
MDSIGILRDFYNIENMSLSESVPLLLLVFFIFSIVSGLVNGLTRGIKKQALHTVCTVEATLLAYFAVRGITQAFVDSFDGETVADLLGKVGLNPEIAGYIDGIDWLLALPVGTIIVPLIFILFFSIVKVGSIIMYHIMKAVLSLPKKETGVANKCSAMLLGAAESFLCFAIFVLPFAGMFGIFDQSVEKLREKDESAYSEFLDFYDENLSPIADHFTFDTVMMLGGDAVLDSFATVENDGEKINLRDEVVSAVSIVTEVSTMKDVDWKALSKEHQGVLNSAVETLDESEYLSIVVSSTLRSMAHAVENGVVPFEVTAPFDVLVNSVVSLFATSNEDNVASDIGSILSVYYILCDERVLDVLGSGDNDAILDCLVEERDGTTVIGKVIAALKENEHTKPLVSTLTELSVTVMSSHLGLGEDSAQVYTNVKEGLKDVLAIKPSDYEDSEEGKAKYKEDLTHSLDTTLKENGIELEPEIVGGIADYIDENVEVKDEYTDEELNDVILSYYDVYLDYQKNGTLPDDLPDDFPSDVPTP